MFKKAGAAILPTAKTDRPVTTGIYRFSRNPMYLGMFTLLLAMAVFAGTLPFYLAAAAYFVVINNVFCPYEEMKLSETFGASCLSYKNEVRRWF